LSQKYSFKGEERITLPEGPILTSRKPFRKGLERASKYQKIRGLKAAKTYMDGKLRMRISTLFEDRRREEGGVTKRRSAVNCLGPS